MPNGTSKPTLTGPHIVLNPNDTRPAHLQIVDQICEQVLAGARRPGEPLPQILHLARELGIGREAISHAYKILGEMQVTTATRSVGTFVAEDVVHNARLMKFVIRQRLANAMLECRQISTSDGIVRGVFHELLDEFFPERRTGDERRDNRPGGRREDDEVQS